MKAIDDKTYPASCQAPLGEGLGGAYGLHCEGSCKVRDLLAALAVAAQLQATMNTSNLVLTKLAQTAHGEQGQYSSEPVQCACRERTATLLRPLSKLSPHLSLGLSPLWIYLSNNLYTHDRNSL
jgi:hypothetical protein